jgi:Protein of unknown function (DUF3617)
MHALERCIPAIFLVAATLAASAQERKPGLYEVTLVTTTVSPSANSYPPRVTQVCLTQSMIDKYGAIVPDNLTHLCQLANVVKKPGGMSADLVCSGPITGNGTLAVNWTDSEHTKGHIHFSGSIHPGENEIKIEWNADTTSVFKSPDCGVVKPNVP